MNISLYIFCIQYIILNFIDHTYPKQYGDFDDRLKEIKCYQNVFEVVCYVVCAHKFYSNFDSMRFIFTKYQNIETRILEK